MFTLLLECYYMMVVDLGMLNTFQSRKNGDTKRIYKQLIQDQLSNTWSNWYSFILLLYLIQNRQSVKIINEGKNKILIDGLCVNNVELIFVLTLFTVMLIVLHISNAMPYLVLECERLQLVYLLEM